jgi:hypothetical protein
MIKSEILNPKSETNSKLEFSKAQKYCLARVLEHWNFGNLYLFSISIFGFRISFSKLILE